MTRSRVAAAAVGAACLIAWAVGGCVVHRAPRPRLVVLIAVDQMRNDYLDHYGSVFTGGFRRLLDEGFRFTNTTVDEAPTNSLPGHTTIATGAYPRRHGIVDNSWVSWDGSQWRWVRPLYDPSHPIVGGKGDGASPRLIDVEALPDWVLAADPHARGIALGTGEYSSLLHAGKNGAEAFWFSPEAGRYVTSTFYCDSLPDWVETFDDNELQHVLADSVWVLTAPPRALALTRADDVPYEYDGVHTHFPHRYDPAAGESRAQWHYFAPFLDGATLNLARRAIEGEHLGRRGTLDCLSIVVSAVDHIGHRYGPWSVEQLDNLLRLDRELGSFFRFLDRTIGKDRWVLALTADHGAPPAPEYAREHGHPNARRISRAEVNALLDRAIAVGDSTRAAGAPADTVSAVVARAIERFDWVRRGITMAELAATGPTDSITTLYRHSYRPNRVSVHPVEGRDHRTLAEFGVIALTEPYDVVDWATSIHGSPYAYDRRVPLVFMGPGVVPGHTDAPARTVDVAPTLAHLAGVPVQGQIDGHVLPIGR